MVNTFEVSPDELIAKVAEELRKDSNFGIPVWTGYVKTGISRERPPLQDTWWHVRCAAILRSVLKLGPIGVSKLRVKYGGKKNRGVRPEKFCKGSGSVIRKALQNLEKAGYVKSGERGNHKGRVVTPAGKSFLDKIAISIIKANKIKSNNTAPTGKVSTPKINKADTVTPKISKPVKKDSKSENKSVNKAKTESKDEHN